MNIFEAIILGIVQGLCEFLPVSSSGHLLLVRQVMGLSGEYLLFDVTVHVGTLIAVCIHFYKDVISMFTVQRRKLWYLMLSTVFAVVVGFLTKIFAPSLVEQTKYLGINFIICAIMLAVAQVVARGRKEQKPFTYKTAISMGLMQAVGVFPGISRSGSTITGGILAKADKNEIASFSFLMSIPIILGSFLLESASAISKGATVIGIAPIIVGFVASFLSGLLAIKFMMKIIKKANFLPFSVYLTVIGIITTVFFS